MAKQAVYVVQTSRKVSSSNCLPPALLLLKLMEHGELIEKKLAGLECKCDAGKYTTAG